MQSWFLNLGSKQGLYALHAFARCVSAAYLMSKIQVSYASSYRKNDKDEAAVWPISQLHGHRMLFVSDGAWYKMRGVVMSLFPTYLNFRNSIEESHPYETLSALMKLLSSLFINIVPHQHN
jgi:hypothetical protein